MKPKNDETKALFSAIAIGMVSLACVGGIYWAFHASLRLKPLSSLVGDTTSQSTSTDSTKGSSSAGSTSGGTSGTTDGSNSSSESSPQMGDSTSSSAGSPSGSPVSNSITGSNSASTGASSGSSSTGSTPTSGSSGSTPTTGTTTVTIPASALKPDIIHKPIPADAYSAISSFNLTKTGNPNWDPTLMANIKQGVATSDRNTASKNFGFSPDFVFNLMSVSTTDNTWKLTGNTATVDGKMSYGIDSQAVTLTLTYTTKWMVVGAAQK